MKTVLITGCSSGIGFSTEFARKDFRVIATMRSIEKANALQKISRDFMRLILTFSLLCLILLTAKTLWAFNNTTLSKIDSKAFSKYEGILQNTTWVVPPSTLLAYQYTAGHENSVQDQTVWIINTYTQGYFFGDAYVALNGQPSSHRRFVGSVTPSGNIYMSFYPTSGTTLSTDIVTGIGVLKKVRGVYVFIMQMNSAPTSQDGLAHWSYMQSVTPNDSYYQNLPSVNMSVPQFVSLFS